MKCLGCMSALWMLDYLVLVFTLIKGTGKSELHVRKIFFVVVVVGKKMKQWEGSAVEQRSSKRGKACHNGHFCFSTSTSNNSKALIVHAESVGM